jgi:hypothetical protein
MHLLFFFCIFWHIPIISPKLNFNIWFSSPCLSIFAQAHFLPSNSSYALSIFWFFQLKMVTCGISTYLSNLVCAPQEGVAPDNAWGPPGGGDRNLKKRENLSVVKQTLPPKSQASREPQEIPGCAWLRFPMVGNCPCHTAINIWGWVKTLVPSEPQNSW